MNLIQIELKRRGTPGSTEGIFFKNMQKSSEKLENYWF
jgi:hypothetical protein